jgi:aryl-alcohol dehydrogenase-like predicted oxidoreductase
LTEPLTTIPLGMTDIQVSPLGLGAWAWGDRLMWGYGFSGYTDVDIYSAYQVSLDAGVNFIDTAEAYGTGRSETLLGSFMKKSGIPVFVATKFMPYPWRISKNALTHALRHSLERLDLDHVDLYQIHWPSPPMPIEHWVEAMAKVFKLGLVRAVGVSNFSETQMRRASSILATHGIPLASNQLQYNLLNRKVEYNGLLDACHELGITLIAYSPIAKGALTGKYTPTHPAPGIRRGRYNSAFLTRLQPLFGLVKEIGQAHGGKTPSQVVCKGALPIPGAKNVRQAQENCGALGWRLTDQEVAALDKISLPFTK